MLPSPTNPTIAYLDGAVEVEGGFVRGCQEKQTNKQEGVTKGGNLSHVLHEGTHFEHSPDLRTPATTTDHHHSPNQQHVHQQEHAGNIFTGDRKFINEEALECITRMVNQDQNDSLTTMPTLTELKDVVFSLNPNSAADLDGMNGYFFQKWWPIIKHDLLGVTQAFFCGQMIPKYFSHSCIVLLPMVSNPNKLTEFRPISLSNFTSKIISKLVSSRLGPMLPNLVSLNQSGFFKGRSIAENIMLAQEIIHQIKKPNIGSNVIIKLHMAKAYDRVFWSYICLVLRRMGFEEAFIDMVWRIMANNWYSIIVNGKRHGFFQSIRGLKQGDPLSSALFTLGAEVLSRSLNRLHNNPEYHGFFMELRGPQVNHFSFAEDIILFTSGRYKTLKLIMQTLNSYEETLGNLLTHTRVIL
uniref:RNA-directed DNA polymerase (Reverse transcriptase); Ribonuclease H n=1 Tax=Solanum tuberosum TaxID=4113 RepID=M1E013_SOLTU